MNDAETNASETVTDILTVNPLGLAMEMNAKKSFDVLLRKCQKKWLEEEDDIEMPTTPLHFAAEQGLMGVFHKQRFWQTHLRKWHPQRDKYHLIN